MIRLTHVHITNIYPNAQNKWKYWTIYWYIIIGNMLWMYTMFLHELPQLVQVDIRLLHINDYYSTILPIYTPIT